MIANADHTPRAKAIGWSRSGDGFGRVTKYHIKSVCNCITSFWGGGYKDPRTGLCNTTPYVLIER
jgi:hypothetical protein